MNESKNIPFEEVRIFALELLQLSVSYCKFIENISQYQKNEILEFFRKILPVIYFKGSVMPEIDFEENDIPEKFVTEEQWHIILLSVKQKMDADDFFLSMLNLDILNAEPEKQSLSENIADIYQDLKDFVLLFQKGTESAQNKAVFERKNTFVKFWGYKICRILPYIHTLIHKEELTDLVNFEQMEE